MAGAALAAFERIGLVHIPVGTGNTALLVRAIETLEPEAVVLTPSYAAYLAENNDLRDSSVQRVLVAGEPGGGEPAFRTKLEEGWGAKVTEAMGVGDIGPSLFGECEEQDGMHLGAHGFVHLELIDPESGEALPLEEDATGELVLTHLQHRAAPLLRFRTRDHVVVKTSPCPCGRTGPRIRCIGRTDDMLIVRGVNVFPSAIREIVNTFTPKVSGHVLVRPRAPGVKQEPPLPVSIELARDTQATDELSEAIGAKLREELTIRADDRARPVRKPEPQRVQVDARAVVTVDEIRAVASALPRTNEGFVRGQVKFRIGRIVDLAISRDGSTMGFAFPKDWRTPSSSPSPRSSRSRASPTCATTGLTSASTPSKRTRCASWSRRHGPSACRRAWPRNTRPRAVTGLCASGRRIRW